MERPKKRASAMMGHIPTTCSAQLPPAPAVLVQHGVLYGIASPTFSRNRPATAEGSRTPLRVALRASRSFFGIVPSLAGAPTGAGGMAEPAVLIDWAVW